MSWKSSVAIMCWAIAFAVTVDTASALNEAASGKVLAEKWCSSCHLVSQDQTHASAKAPPFGSIAKRPDEELNRLSFFLLDPHPLMPNFNLTRNEITDLVAYIRSLKQ